jgi:hypothetical protein
MVAGYSKSLKVCEMYDLAITYKEKPKSIFAWTYSVEYLSTAWIIIENPDGVEKIQSLS